MGSTALLKMIIPSPDLSDAARERDCEGGRLARRTADAAEVQRGGLNAAVSAAAVHVAGVGAHLRRSKVTRIRLWAAAGVPRGSEIGMTASAHRQADTERFDCGGCKLDRDGGGGRDADAKSTRGGNRGEVVGLEAAVAAADHSCDELALSVALVPETLERTAEGLRFCGRIEEKQGARGGRVERIHHRHAVQLASLRRRRDGEGVPKPLFKYARRFKSEALLITQEQASTRERMQERTRERESHLDVRIRPVHPTFHELDVLLRQQRVPGNADIVC